MLASITVNKPHTKAHQDRILNLVCDFCKRCFTARYKLRVAQKAEHFCSRRCAWDHKKIDASVPRVRSCVCEKCGSAFQRCCNTNQTTPKFCSKSCARSALSKRLNLSAHMNTPEVRARSVATHRATCAKWRSGELKNPLKGLLRAPTSEATREKLRAKNGGKNNAFYGKTHSEEARAKMRDSRSKLIIAGKMNWALFGHKSGAYESTKMKRSFHFRSSWEEIAMKWLDNSESVAAWDFECVRIPYEYNNNKRWYVPDFLVTFSDGHREMWEVKVRSFIGAEKVALKAAAAEAYCVTNKIAKYVMIVGDDVKRMSQEIETFTRVTR